MVRRVLLALGAVAIVGVVVYALLPQPAGVDVAVVERGLLRVTVDEDGQTRIKERYVVSSPLSGRLLRIDLDPGDSVKAGETMVARIEPTAPELLDPRARAEAQARVNAAEARLQQAAPELQKALAAMQYAESELGRERQLLLRKATSKLDVEEQELLFRTRTEEYNSARFAEEIARFEKELAESALLRTQSDSDTVAEDWYFEIKAPIDGRVLRVLQESATVVSPGTSLLEVGDPRDLEVIVDVLSHDAVKVLPGAKVFLEHWGGDAPLVGTVRLVEPSGFTKISALGVEEQRVWVIVDFDDPPADRTTLGDGFRVEARIVIWERPDVLKVPVSALFRSGDDWSVFAISDDRAQQRQVKIGQRNGLEAELLDGLQPGDRVVVHPSDQVTPGVKVYPRNGGLHQNGGLENVGETIGARGSDLSRTVAFPASATGGGRGPARMLGDGQSAPGSIKVVEKLPSGAGFPNRSKAKSRLNVGIASGWVRGLLVRWCQSAFRLLAEEEGSSVRRHPLSEKKGGFMRKLLAVTVMGLGLAIYAGCEQTAQDQAADEVRDESQDQAEGVRDATQEKADEIREAGDRAEEAGDRASEAAENQADKTEAAGEKKADELEEQGEKKADELEEQPAEPAAP